MQTKTAFLFSGQGSQSPGMGAELLQLCPAAGRVFEAAADILGFDLKEACFTWEAEALAQTEISQPAILAVSLAAFEAVRGLGLTPAMGAGHSLGEYAAMTAAGMLTLEDAFRVIKARAAAMGRCAKSHPGAMCAVMADADEIAAVCAGTEGLVLPVNYNSPVQTVIAGETAAVEQAMEVFAARGKRCIKLAVSAAFHTPLMQEAADEFQAAITSVPFAAPKFPLYSNVTGGPLADWSDMPGYLARHLVSPVRFTTELAAMREAGAERFVECGPGKVLTGLVKKTLAGAAAFNVENQKSLEKLKESLL